MKSCQYCGNTELSNSYSMGQEPERHACSTHHERLKDQMRIRMRGMQ